MSDVGVAGAFAPLGGGVWLELDETRVPVAVHLSTHRPDRLRVLEGELLVARAEAIA